MPLPSTTPPNQGEPHIGDTPGAVTPEPAVRDGMRDAVRDVIRDTAQDVVRDRGDACPGALRLHTADDGKLARLRLPGGILTDRQVEALAVAAERYGDGHLGITSRGNAELRGIGDHCGNGLAELLRHTALLPSERHERIRNIVASPLAGLDGRGHGSLLPWLRELDALLCAQDWTTALSGRFLFALDDGRGDVTALGGDVTLLAQGGTREGRTDQDGSAGRRPATALIRTGEAAPLRVAASDAPRAALTAAHAFLAAAADAGTGAWRVRELPPGHEVDLAAALARAGIPAEPAPAPRTPPAPAPRPGIVASPDGTYAVLVAPVLGRVTSTQLRALAGPGGEIRITPWRGFVVTGFDERGAQRRLRELGDAGFITDPGSAWSGVGACTGRPGCAKALADVRRDALPGTGGLAGTAAPPGTGGLPAIDALPVYWSGCARRCGHPHGDWVDVTATADGSYTVTARSGTAEQQLPYAEGELADTIARARGGRR
ncbi:cobalamin biosynthesis protein CobG [Streptomyces sp. NPDC006691]|uniref:cobalamin biosynthesis protein CobG n=1 Tax=Streptomyces sp. NPDC006691 TaxID=3364757 RepID=UPI003674C9D5